MTDETIVSTAVTSSDRSMNHIAHRSEAVHDQGRSRRDEVDDCLGEPESGSDLDRARDRNDIDPDPLLIEEAASRIGMGRGNAQTIEVTDRAVRRVVRDRGSETAVAVAELAHAGQLGARLDQQVDAGDPEVGYAVTDEFDDVVRPNEQDVEVEVLHAGDERAVVLLEHEPGVVEQLDRRLDQPPLVGDGQAQALAHRSTPVG
jgi:hypothetical protein